MNTTSLELCKELYKLSGWDDIEKWSVYEQSDLPEGKVAIYEIGYIGPLYDLGYLLRKLPHEIGSHTALSIKQTAKDLWLAYYSYEDDSFDMTAHTPEDAIAKLAIELFKQGILTNEAN